ncbi:MAG: hypothetical protein KUG77_07810 [Nannocystaceae bacterium]|nr:hypothetical protein [Nannocystaceae bacterium]
MMRRAQLSLTFALALGLLACEAGNSDANETDTPVNTTGEDGSGDTNPTTTNPSTTGPVDCIAGQETCVCLENNCIGTLECVHDLCVPGSEFDIPDDPIRVIAGLRVPINAEILADEFSWAQTGGPDANATGIDTQSPLIDVPAGASGGDVLTFTLTAIRNEVEATADVTIEIVEANFEEGLPMIMDPEQLGTPNTVSFRGGQLWAVMDEGFVSWFDLDFDDTLEVQFAVHMGRQDIPGAPFGARMGQVPDRDDDIDVLLIANTGNQALEALSINGGNLETLSDETVDGEPLGAVRHLVRMDDEIYLTNGEGGQLLVWDQSPPQDDAGGSTGGDPPTPAGTRVLLEDLVMPSAVISGPEDGFLYLGVAGEVLRVPILEDGEAGQPSVYLSFGDNTDPNLMVDGLQFDRANNLYVGVPLDDRLVVARYAAGEETEAIRDIDTAGANFSDFGGLRFGDDDFGGGTLYYGNASGRVGRVFVGLGD